jgi:hypothetical protein
METLGKMIFYAGIAEPAAKAPRVIACIRPRGYKIGRARYFHSR